MRPIWSVAIESARMSGNQREAMRVFLTTSTMTPILRQKFHNRPQDHVTPSPEVSIQLRAGGRDQALDCGGVYAQFAERISDF